MTSHRWKVVVTDGTISKMLFWFDGGRSGVYYGQYVLGWGGHKSYHTDGTTNLHTLVIYTDYQGVKHKMGAPKDVYPSEPIKDVTFQLLGGHVIDTDLTQKRYELYEPKSNETRIIYIDSRDFENAFECDFYLVSPLKHESFEQSLKKYPKLKVMYITEWEPHIGIIVYNVK